MELYRQAAEQGQLVDPEKFSTAVLTLLRTKTPEQLSTLRGAGEGLENRLYAAAREAETVNDLYDRLKTKRYPTVRKNSGGHQPCGFGGAGPKTANCC